MFTKVQAEIMKLFASSIDKRFSRKQVSDILKKPYPLIHRNIKVLLIQKFLKKDDKGFISLNYKNNISELSYIESLRKNKFLGKEKTFSLFAEDVLNSIKSDFFIFLVFGSSVEKKGRDMDVLFITEKNTNEIEKAIINISSNFSVKIDVNVISAESAYEMLQKREQKNLLNETLNKHIIIFGAENYYRILKNAR